MGIRVAVTAAALALAAGPAGAQDTPPSDLASATARTGSHYGQSFREALGLIRPVYDDGVTVETEAEKQGRADTFYASAYYRRLAAAFPATVSPSRIDGVFVEQVMPQAGIPPGHARRVLIDLHGGAFVQGARWHGRTEALPMAHFARTRVISVDYRQGASRFPAATEDVLRVYRALLKTHAPGEIGIFGDSAGALLTAEVVAALIKARLPLPGAIALLSEGGAFWLQGDSGRAETGPMPRTSRATAYFRDTAPDDADAFPIRSAATLAQFPPTLLVSATRDVALSSVVATHAALSAGGVAAELHVWEGLGHEFFVIDPDLPESREAYAAITRFFDRHLAR